ncbi:MAG TPA: hypothetical protein VEI74_03040 [Candidatus Methylomirabilis sp.]|nr:hypothetical protein [Candidatus Methylomirabilis sp.]
MINRRNFLGTGVVALASLVLSPIKLLASPFRAVAREGVSRFQLSKQDFLELLNTTFAVHAGTGARVNMNLIEVKDGPASLHAEQFTLTFRAPSTPSLSEGLYAIEHAGAGGFPLFLQTVGHDDTARWYRATFSLLN